LGKLRSRSTGCYVEVKRRIVRALFPGHAVHPLAAWKDILRGNPIRARQVLKKLVVGPIRMEPMPKVHEYR
jgi:hypothetical protein